MNITSVYWCCAYFTKSRISVPGPWWIVHIFKQRKFHGISQCGEKSLPTPRKYHYKRRSLNVLCQNIGYFVQRWEYMQFTCMPCMKCQFGFVADFVEVNCKGNWKLWSNCYAVGQLNMCIFSSTDNGRGQDNVAGLATRTVSNPTGNKTLSVIDTRPDRRWSPPSILYNG